MNNRVACIIIATERRRDLVRNKVLPSVLAQDFDDVILVGDWIAGNDMRGVRYLHVAPLTHTTTDALVKRDVGTLATSADNLVYLCDDHALAPHFLTELCEVLNEGWDVLVPNRFTFPQTPDMPPIKMLNNGEHSNYCGGHGGVFKRHVITERPWSAHKHDRLWDLYSSHWMLDAGYEFCWRPRAPIAIIDLEPERKPWL